MSERTLDEYQLNQQEQAERAQMERILREKGYTFIYGGGSKSKGHGFWVYRNGKNLRCPKCREYGYFNPSFWVYQALVDRFTVARINSSQV